MAAPLGVPMGAAVHAAIPARVHAAVDAVEPAEVRVLGAVNAPVKMTVMAVVTLAAKGLRSKSWTAFNLLEQT